jgi:hypothetical protein
MPGLAQNLSFILLGEDKSASKAMHGAESTATKVTANIGGAFGKLGGIIGGEFGEVLDKVGEGIETVGEHGKHLGKTLQIAGGVTTAAGVGLLALSSDLKGATDQLDAAIKTTGKSTEEYSEEIEKAVQKGQNFNHNAVETKKALTTLVSATGDTKVALERMSVVTDLAAAKHISLEAAATQVAKILNGSGGKTLAAYGITMEKSYDNTKDLANAHDRLLKAQQGVQNSQIALSRLEAIDHGKKTLSISDNFRLADAHKKVTDAKAMVAQATTNLNDLEGTSITKQKAGAEAIEQLSAKLKGQGAASVDNFGAQVSIVTTKIKDWVDEVAGPLGSALSGLGPVLTVVGLGVDLYRSKQEAAAAATLAQAAAAGTAAVAETEAAGAMVALDVAMDANPIGIVAAALGGLALVAGGIALANQKDLTEATKSYTSALSADNEMIGKNTRITAAKALSDSGALQAAVKLGISPGLLVDATLGLAGAKKKLADETDKVNKKLDIEQKNMAEGAGASAAQVRAYDKQWKALKVVTDSVGDQSTALKDATKKEQIYTSAINTVNGKLHLTNDELEELTARINKLPDKVGLSVTTTGGVAYSDSRNSSKKPHKANGGDVSQSEYTLVGENGPEVVGLPGGSHVFPSQRGGLGGGGINVQVHVAGSVHATEAGLVKAFTNGLINALQTGGVNRADLRRALGF